MARPISKWEAKDGTEFNSQAAAEEHEALCERCRNAVESVLGPRRDIPGSRYVQHDRDAALQAKRNMLAILREKHGSYEVFKNPDDEIHPMSFVGRLADEIGGPIGHYWNRLCRINFDNFREYEQPFYDLNPEKAPQEAME